MKKILLLASLVLSVIPAFAVVGCEQSTTYINNRDNQDKNLNGDGNQKGDDKEPTQAEKDLKLDWENSRTIDGEDRNKKTYFVKHMDETFSQTVADIRTGLEGQWEASYEDQKEIDKYSVLIFDKKIYLMTNIYTSYIGLKYLNNEIIIKNVFDVDPIGAKNCGIVSESQDQLNHYENIVYDSQAMTFVFKNEWHQNYTKWQFDKDANILTLLEAENTYK